MSAAQSAGLTRVLVLVSDSPTGAVGLRARALFSRLPVHRFSTSIVYRESKNLGAAVLFVNEIRRKAPDVVYIQNIGAAGAIAAFVAALGRGRRLVVETGDPLGEHFRNSGRPELVCRMISRAERIVLSLADDVVVRGSGLADYFQGLGIDRSYCWLPDGVDLGQFRPLCTDSVKRMLGLEGKYVVGTVGRLAWNRAHGIGYGWDIVEAISRIADEDVVGMVVGDGDGLPRLKELAAERGVADRLRFPGRVPHERVPLYINAMDICVSTQTNDPVGRGRTTAKLPEFLACGRLVVATDVGEAATLLKGTGQLLPYSGLRDDEHPARLADRIAAVRQQDRFAETGQRNRKLAERLFDYDALAQRLEGLLETAVRS